MILLVSRIAILTASCMVPREIRAGWRRVWMCEIQHYAILLRRRGLKDRYVRARTRHHLMGAMQDAWRIFAGTPAALRFRSAAGTPWFCLGLVAMALAVIVLASRGLAITRAMVAPPFPDAGRLVLISEGNVLPGQRHPTPPALLDYWRMHATTFAGLAGYRWDGRGRALVTPDFFAVVGVRPRVFLLRRIRDWKPLTNPQDLGVIGRLKPGVTPAAAQSELRVLASRYRHNPWPAAVQPAQVMSLVARIRKPLYAYATVCAATALLLLAAACFGMRTDRRRIGRIRRGYWAYFCAKSVSLPLALALVIWEFSRATSFDLIGGSTFVAEPFFVWLVILACGAIVWWCLADQRARCRACLRTLQYPVRIGSLGAVLFDHAGMELMCCEGHGALYVPAVSSDYVQRGGWTALDAGDITEPARR